MSVGYLYSCFVISSFGQLDGCLESSPPDGFQVSSACGQRLERLWNVIAGRWRLGKERKTAARLNKFDLGTWDNQARRPSSGTYLTYRRRSLLSSGQANLSRTVGLTDDSHSREQL